MKAIIVDLEMNNPSNRIIEIGAVLVNTKSHQVLDVFSKLANPGELPSEFIHQLTGISPKMIEQADPLSLVLVDFWKWVEDCECGKTVYAWGGDVNILKQQSKEMGVEAPWLATLDLKEMTKIFRQAKDAKSKGGLKNTLALFGLEFQETPHFATWDALNTAFLLFRLEEIIYHGINLEKTHGNPKVRNLDRARQEMKSLEHKLCRR